MAAAPVLSIHSSKAVRRIGRREDSSGRRFENRTGVRVRRTTGLLLFPPKLSINRRWSSTRLYAAEFAEIEPDLNEDPVDRWRTNGVTDEEFQYGIWDGHHLYNEGEEQGSFWESIAEDYAAMDPPKGFQGLISWLFLPAIAAGMYFNVPGEYLYVGAAVFVTIFCIIEINKPSEPHNFEPQIYNMERQARDKLIADYNTMDIWEFNEKYGDLWDFTVKKDDIMKR